MDLDRTELCLQHYYSIFFSVLILKIYNVFYFSWWYALLGFVLPFLIVIPLTYLNYRIQKRKIDFYFRNRIK